MNSAAHCSARATQRSTGGQSFSVKLDSEMLVRVGVLHSAEVALALDKLWGCSAFLNPRSKAIQAEFVGWPDVVVHEIIAARQWKSGQAGTTVTAWVVSFAVVLEYTQVRPIAHARSPLYL